LESILLQKLSVLLGNQKAFVALIAFISALKLILSGLEPASFDLRDIITLVQSPQTSIGPWIALYPPLYAQSASNATLFEQWWLTPPPAMGFNLQLISLSFRLPIFILDLSTGIVLYYAGKSIGSDAMGRLASLIWFANPYSFVAAEILGVPDILATFLVILSLTFLIKKHFFVGAIFLGLGAWVKFYPFLFLLPVLLFEHKSNASLRDKAATLSFGLAGLAGYLWWTLPSWELYLTTYTPVAQPFPFVAGETAINNSAVVLILFYCVMVFFAKNTKSLIALLLPTLLVYYAVSNPAPQYLIWALPLMALDVALVDRSRAYLFVTFCILAFANWFFTSSAFLTPSGYSLLMVPLGGNNLPSYSQAITQLLDNSPVVNLLLPLVSSALFACVLAYAIDVGRTWFRSAKEEVSSNEG
jgi:hypothetical protein